MYKKARDNSKMEADWLHTQIYSLVKHIANLFKFILWQTVVRLVAD